MLVQVFSVFDVKAKSYLKPFFVPNEDVAKRAIKDVMSDELSEFARNPEDYVLYHIGEWDDQSGVITPDNPAYEVCKVLQFVGSYSVGGDSNVE